MASGCAITVIPADGVTQDQLQEAFRPAILNHTRDGVLDRDSTYPDTEDELVAFVTDTGRRGNTFAVVKMRWLYDISDVVDEVTRTHADLIDGLIRVGAETTRGSMNAQYYEVDDNGNREVVGRDSHDSYPIGGHRYTFRGVTAVNPEL